MLHQLELEEAWLLRKKREDSSGFRPTVCPDVSQLCRCYAVLLDGTPTTTASDKSDGLLVHLYVLLIASPEGEMKNKVLGRACSFLWVSPVC